LGDDNFIRKTTCTEAKKYKVEFESLVKILTRDVFNMDNDSEDHFDHVDPEKGEINGVDDELNFMGLSFEVGQDVD
jgi:hypothetical protein